ncbi:hypothetical protein HCJ96_16065 [Alteromonas sp. MYP5]|uniref:DUF6883 domain-containing protein n=2 Tax=Alteromonas ponticola TaxID=2720613 RepID=A0ABX1R534_9ALTE|nr:hypothetical protein [Alteromonas ponticola]
MEITGAVNEFISATNNYNSPEKNGFQAKGNEPSAGNMDNPVSNVPATGNYVNISPETIDASSVTEVTDSISSDTETVAQDEFAGAIVQLNENGENSLSKIDTTKISVDTKLEKYLLNKEHPVGASKAKWFEAALGFNIENSNELSSQIVFDEQAAVKTELTQHGQKYNQIIPIIGANGRTIDVTFAWIKTSNDNEIKLVTAIPAKK